MWGGKKKRLFMKILAFHICGQNLHQTIFHKKGSAKDNVLHVCVFVSHSTKQNNGPGKSTLLAHFGSFIWAQVGLQIPNNNKNLYSVLIIVVLKISQKSVK